MAVDGPVLDTVIKLCKRTQACIWTDSGQFATHSPHSHVDTQLHYYPEARMRRCQSPPHRRSSFYEPNAFRHVQRQAQVKKTSVRKSIQSCLSDNMPRKTWPVHVLEPDNLCIFRYETDLHFEHISIGIHPTYGWPRSPHVTATRHTTHRLSAPRDDDAEMGISSQS